MADNFFEDFGIEPEPDIEDSTETPVEDDFFSAFGIEPEVEKGQRDFGEDVPWYQLAETGIVSSFAGLGELLGETKPIEAIKDAVNFEKDAYKSGWLVNKLEDLGFDGVSDVVDSYSEGLHSLKEGFETYAGTVPRLLLETYLDAVDEKPAEWLDKPLSPELAEESRALRKDSQEYLSSVMPDDLGKGEQVAVDIYTSTAMSLPIILAMGLTRGKGSQGLTIGAPGSYYFGMTAGESYGEMRDKFHEASAARDEAIKNGDYLEASRLELEMEKFSPAESRKYAAQQGAIMTAAELVGVEYLNKVLRTGWGDGLIKAVGAHMVAEGAGSGASSVLMDLNSVRSGVSDKDASQIFYDGLYATLTAAAGGPVQSIVGVGVGTGVSVAAAGGAYVGEKVAPEWMERKRAEKELAAFLEQQGHDPQAVHEYVGRRLKEIGQTQITEEIDKTDQTIEGEFIPRGEKAYDTGSHSQGWSDWTVTTNDDGSVTYTTTQPEYQDPMLQIEQKLGREMVVDSDGNVRWATVNENNIMEGVRQEALSKGLTPDILANLAKLQKRHEEKEITDQQFIEARDTIMEIAEERGENYVSDVRRVSSTPLAELSEGVRFMPYLKLEPMKASSEFPSHRKWELDRFNENLDAVIDELADQGIQIDATNRKMMYTRFEPRQIVDRATGIYGEKFAGVGDMDTIAERTQEWVAENPEEYAAYIEGDMRNLGGLNSELTPATADKVMSAFAHIALNELRSRGWSVNPVRKGGDEFGYFVVGKGSDKSLKEAIKAAEKRVDEYVEDRGLGAIKHTKMKEGELGAPGTGMLFAHARITVNAPLKPTIDEVGAMVEVLKKEYVREYYEKNPQEDARVGEDRRSKDEHQKPGEEARYSRAESRREGQEAARDNRKKQKAERGRAGTPEAADAKRRAINSVLQKVSKQLGIPAENIVIAPESDWPGELRMEIGEAGVTDALGLYWPKDGKVYINPDKHKTVRNAQITALHEIIGHYGVHRLFFENGKLNEKAFNRFLDEIWTARGEDIRNIWEKMDNYDPADGKQRRTAVEEFIAKEAEKMNDIPLIRKLFDFIMGRIRKLMGKEEQWSIYEIRDLLRKSKAGVYKDRMSVTTERSRTIDRDFARYNTESPVFFSQALRVIGRAEGAPKKGTGEQWIKWLDGRQKNGELKQAERDWLLIDEWLAAKEGPVTISEVQEYVRDNQLELEITQLGGPRLPSPKIKYGQTTVERLVEEAASEIEGMTDEDIESASDYRVPYSTTLYDNFGNEIGEIVSGHDLQYRFIGLTEELTEAFDEDFGEMETNTILLETMQSNGWGMERGTLKNLVRASLASSRGMLREDFPVRTDNITVIDIYADQLPGVGPDEDIIFDQDGNEVGRVTFNDHSATYTIALQEIERNNFPDLEGRYQSMTAVRSALNNVDLRITEYGIQGDVEEALMDAGITVDYDDVMDREFVNRDGDILGNLVWNNEWGYWKWEAGEGFDDQYPSRNFEEVANFDLERPDNDTLRDMRESAYDEAERIVATMLINGGQNDGDDFGPIADRPDPNSAIPDNAGLYRDDGTRIGRVVRFDDSYTIEITDDIEDQFMGIDEMNFQADEVSELFDEINMVGLDFEVSDWQAARAQTNAGAPQQTDTPALRPPNEQNESQEIQLAGRFNMAVAINEGDGAFTVMGRHGPLVELVWDEGAGGRWAFERADDAADHVVDSIIDSEDLRGVGRNESFEVGQVLATHFMFDAQRRRRDGGEGAAFESLTKGPSGQAWRPAKYTTRYVTPGGKNHVELVISAPQIQPHAVFDTQHFSDVSKGKDIMWVRAADFAGPNGEKLLHIEELQSKRHQAARRKKRGGTIDPETGKPEKVGYAPRPGRQIFKSPEGWTVKRNKGESEVRALSDMTGPELGEVYNKIVGYNLWDDLVDDHERQGLQGEPDLNEVRQTVHEVIEERFGRGLSPEELYFLGVIIRPGVNDWQFGTKESLEKRAENWGVEYVYRHEATGTQATLPIDMVNDMRSDGAEISEADLMDPGAMMGTIEQLVEIDQEGLGSIPWAPFQGNEWVELGLKRMIRYATENGYDGLTWTPGQVQADRYSLSGVVDEIGVKIKENGLRDVEVYVPGHSMTRMEVDQNGNVLRSNVDRLEGEMLSNVLGEEVSQKILSMDSSDVIDGDGLRIGGQGMKQFYDKTVPNIAKKVLKKLDKKARVGQLDAGETLGKVWSLELTDSVRENAMEGMPIFRRDEGVETGVAMVKSVSSLEGASKRAASKVYTKIVDLKQDVQDDVRQMAEEHGIDLTDHMSDYMVSVATDDALYALRQNENAVGWYGIKTQQALAIMSKLHPEIKDSEDARFAFTWAMAVTSNGLKVDKNFELAEKAYEYYKANGKMPTNIGIGNANQAINNSMQLFNDLVESWGIDNLRKFALTDFEVGEIRQLGLKLDGEHAEVVVRGAGILGPKIGNGFFSNLYGKFDALTMDRWLIRTWGRWNGTLILDNPEATAKATRRLEKAIANLSETEAARIADLIGMDFTGDVSDIALAIEKASVKPAIRNDIASTGAGNEIRLAGNGLAKALDGQKEAPYGPWERRHIRELFGTVLDRVQTEPGYEDLTMADLQAALWYAEKRLYETSKVDVEEDSEIDGYQEEDAPDYANAAAKLARSKGVTDRRINNALKEGEENGRTATARSAGESREHSQQREAGGFAGTEKRQFQQGRAVIRARSYLSGNGKQSRAYQRRGGGDGKRVRVLGKMYPLAGRWKLDTGLAKSRILGNSNINTPDILEVAATPETAAMFERQIQQNKANHPFGAAVYVYPIEEYQGMRLFVTKDGKSGFALKPDGDIVSVFSTDGNGHAMMLAAVAAGGKKLDAFDTILPPFYEAHGFKAVARNPWVEEFSPEGWDKQRFGKYNNGEPDVVFMAYDPEHTTTEYNKKSGKLFAGEDAYDKAAAEQSRVVKRMDKKTSTESRGPLFRKQEEEVHSNILSRAINRITNMGKTGSGGLNAAGEYLFFSSVSKIADIGTPTATKLAAMFRTPVFNPTGENFAPDFRLRAERFTGRFSSELFKTLEPIRGRLGLSKSDNAALVAALRSGRPPVDQKLATAYRRLRALMNDIHAYAEGAGLDIGFVENYFPRIYDTDKIIANPDGFVKLLTDNGIPKRVAENVMRKIIDEEGVFDARVDTSGRLRDFDNFQPWARAMGKEGGSVRSSAEKSRVIDIPEEILKDWLVNDVDAVIANYAQGIAHRAEYVRTFGANEEILNQMVRDIIIEAEVYDVPQSAKRIATSIYNMADMSQGVFNPIESIGYRKFTRGVGSYETIAKLPLVTLSSLAEFGIVMGESRQDAILPAMKVMGDALNETAATLLNLTTGNRILPKTEMRQAAEDIGLILPYVLEQKVANRFSGVSGASVTAYMKAVGLTQLTNIQRMVGYHAGLARIKRHGQWFAENQDKAGSRTYDSKAEALYSMGISPEQAIAFAQTGDFADIAGMAAMNFSKRMVQDPRPEDLPEVLNDPHATLVIQFKRFTASISNTLLKRYVQQLAHGKHPLDKLQGLLTALFSTMIAYFTTFLRDYIRYGDSEENPYRDYDDMTGRTIESLDRAGMLGHGTYGASLVAPRYGYADSSAKRLFNLLGPFASDITSVMDIGQAIRDGKPEEAAKKMARITPFVNMTSAGKESFIELVEEPLESASETVEDVQDYLEDTLP